MGKVGRVRVLDRLLGKSIFFQGRFDYGEQERLGAMAEAQQGLIASALDASVDYLVLADLSAGKTVQKKAQSLNAKGANIQVMDADAFQKLVEPTAEEVLALIRGGKQKAERLAKILGRSLRYYGQGAAKLTFAAERFEGLDLSRFDFGEIDFEQCSFAGSTLSDVWFAAVKHCDFSNAKGGSTTFGHVTGSKFHGAKLKSAEFEGDIANADFSGAMLEAARFVPNQYRASSPKQLWTVGVVFSRANLRSGSFHGLSLKSPDFEGADLTGAGFSGCMIEAAKLSGADLQDASLIGCKMRDGDLSGANLRGANLADAILTNARFDGADLAGCNLRGAQLQGVDLSNAKNYDPAATPAGAVGPALTELNSLMTQARRIHIEFHVRDGADGNSESIGIDTNGLRYGWGVRVPSSLAAGQYRHQSAKTISDAMLTLANMLGHRQVRYETVDVQSTKSPTGGKELRDLVNRGIAEAFAQPVPAADELAKATKDYRQQVREQGAADRERRQKAKETEEKRQAAAKKQIEKKVAKAVGKVTDIASFLKALEVRIEKPKIDKATKMLKAERFKLFNDVTDEFVSGVVKSQTDPDLVYACRIDHEGQYACCTQNLNICGGLRGSICKHLLVLIIGLVKAGELDPTTIDGWVARTHRTKAELDKELMGAIFIKYKGAEAGEVDWRPTETLPEDYYSL